MYKILKKGVTMNFQLEKLFQSYNLTKKDQHDFRQIYNLLPPHKKVRAVENFVSIMLSIESLREKLYIEHEILFGDTLDSIESKLKVLKQDLKNVREQNATHT
ncbi:hypothetical protein N9J72_02270 [Candidatus Gracilibacteria bacterium]|nr:hypothetical protein [Candidatus Gracilibacteria bacterium]